MAEKPAAERTEQPTQRKLDKAREKGQLAQSQELPAVVSIIVLMMVLTLTASSLMHWFITEIKAGMSGQIDFFVDNKSFIEYFNAKMLSTIVVSLPSLAALLIGSVLSCIVVSGLNFAPEAIKLKFDEINPVKGFSRLFDVNSLVKLGISIAKIIIISVVVWFYLRSKIEEIAVIRWSYSEGILATISKMVLGMLIRVCLALLIIAMIDVLFQKWKYISDMKMTKQEVKQERKDTEGSPELKSRIRQIQMAMARKRMLKEIPKANVILVNPTHFAVALRYDSKTMDAPILVAKGADHIAEKIREIGRAYGVPIIRRPELTRTIYSTVKPGQAIPDSLYTAVAEVLAMIYRLRHRRV